MVDEMFCLAFVFNSLQLTRVDPLELQISFTKETLSTEKRHIYDKNNMITWCTVLWKHKRKNTGDVFILSITRKLLKGSMRQSMWSGLNDLWICKAFTYKCVQKREREKRGRKWWKWASPRHGWGSYCNSMPVWHWSCLNHERTVFNLFRQCLPYTLYYLLT